jgi:hypothetical protein
VGDPDKTILWRETPDDPQSPLCAQRCVCAQRGVLLSGSASSLMFAIITLHRAMIPVSRRPALVEARPTP